MHLVALYHVGINPAACLSTTAACVRGLGWRHPPACHGGLRLVMCRSWLVPVFTVTDEELLLSAGMDALVRGWILGWVWSGNIQL